MLEVTLSCPVSVSLALTLWVLAAAPLPAVSTAESMDDIEPTRPMAAMASGVTVAPDSTSFATRRRHVAAVMPARGDGGMGSWSETLPPEPTDDTDSLLTCRRPRL